jgi:hypothetical protein
LPKQIPALIERDLDRLEPAVLTLIQAAFAAAVVELVLFGHELLDSIVDPFVFHLHPFLCRRGRARRGADATPIAGPCEA